ncbi:MAG: glycosyl transferase [Bacteroidaceae bacterium]|nr:glycosyl transferase [Bacteroidaceae bacterium]
MNDNLIVKIIRLLPDKPYLSLKFYKEFGRIPNWTNPQTFSEKLQWLKLYDRKPKYTMMVDKFAVKDYVASKIGSEYVIPTLGVWDRPEDIEWGKLPKQFVLKTTHGGGNEGVVICRDKTTFDKEGAIDKLNKSLHSDLYVLHREWPYKNVPKRVIAEEFIKPRPDTKDLADFKFFCFDGKVKGLFVATERQNPNEEVKFDFFDEDYNYLPFRQGHNHAAVVPPKPQNFELMKIAAEKLSKGIPHVRVDLYDLGNTILFGELTFFHFSGLVKFEPEEWDYKFGEWLKLPTV